MRLLYVFIIALFTSCTQHSSQSSSQPKPQPQKFGAAPGNPYFGAPSWGNGQTITLDPNNSTTCASDTNSCLSASCSGSSIGPCLHWYEFMGRWAGTSPIFTANTTIRVMSTQPSLGEGDPVVFTPIIKGAAQIQLIGDLSSVTQVSTGTITVTNAKNRATNQDLTCTFSGTTNSGNLIVNNTRASRVVFVGSSGIVGQPLSGTQTNTALPTEDDSWTTGNSYTDYAQAGLNILRIDPTIDQSVSNIPLLVAQLDFLNTGANSNGSYESVILNGPLTVSDSEIDRSVISYNGGGHTPAIRFINNFYNGNVGIVGPPPTASGTPLVVNVNSVVNSQVPTLFGGNTNGSLNTSQMSVSSVWLDYDIRIMDSTAAVLEGSNFYGCVEVAGAQLRLSQGYARPTIAGACTTNAIVWGSAGQIDLDGTSRWSYTGATAVNTFLLGSGLRLNGRQSAGCGHSNGATDVINCGIAVTAANLDAAQGIAGFGGLAFLFGGASFSSTP